MGNTVTLKHGRFAPPKKIVYFYDGLLVAENGLLTIPADKPHWVRRAWVWGYNLNPSGERLWTLGDVYGEMERQTAMSAKGENESSDSGRQPTAKDRVRKSQRGSGESISE